MPLAASLDICTFKARRGIPSTGGKENGIFRETSEEGAIKPQIASKIEETKEPNQITSLNFKVVKLRHREGASGLSSHSRARALMTPSQCSLFPLCAQH